MTPDERAEIRERADLATGGPWECHVVHSFMDGRVQARIAPLGRPKVVDGVMPFADADFIARGRADVPRLLDALDEFGAAVELTAFTQQVSAGLAPGVYISQPQGHALIADTQRTAAVLDLGGAVSIAGVSLSDWGALAQLGRHLSELAARKSAASAKGEDPAQ